MHFPGVTLSVVGLKKPRMGQTLSSFYQLFQVKYIARASEAFSTVAYTCMYWSSFHCCIKQRALCSTDPNPALTYRLIQLLLKSITKGLI